MAIIWNNGDSTGGQVDVLFDAVRRALPAVLIERLDVTHPADDNNVWFIGDADEYNVVQVDTAVGGMPPFIVEDDHERVDTSDSDVALRAILRGFERRDH